MTKDEDLLHFGLYYRHHKKAWSNDQVVLLGDACHATLPYVGQGANQAIEDAIYLADCLDKQNDYNAAYEDYYKRRFPRTKRVVQMAGIMHKLYHSESWILQGILEYLLKSVIKGGAILKQIENEIIKECPVQDYQRYAPRP
jgi:2-polyprenyl-6-methoxyphenol hydroxylase-like FAD-dependent oxidoreductase